MALGYKIEEKDTIKGPECPPLSLKLFLSVDLVGSTAFKQSIRASYTPADAKLSPLLPEQGWIAHLASFFRGFEEKFLEVWRDEWRDVPQSCRGNCREVRPQFWKSYGDEAIFTIDIDHPIQAVMGVFCFSHAMDKYRSHLKTCTTGQNATATKALDLKGTCWIAEFPVTNIELLQVNDDAYQRRIKFVSESTLQKNIITKIQSLKKNLQSHTIEYIGPQIDLGFRLSQFATPRKLILSIDLIYILSSTISGADSKLDHYAPKLYFDKKEGLKGILSGRPYPIIWSDTKNDEDLHRYEDLLSYKTDSHQVKLEAFNSYAKEFLKSIHQSHPWANIPYIGRDGVNIYGVDEFSPEIRQNAYQAYQKDWATALTIVQELEASEMRPTACSAPPLMHPRSTSEILPKPQRVADESFIKRL